LDNYERFSMEQPCPKCGSQNADDLNFCIYCGNKLELTSISTKVPQFRFPPMRSLAADNTSTAGYSEQVDFSVTSKSDDQRPFTSKDIDKTEYSGLPVSSTDNIEFDLPAGWVTSNTGYNTPVSGVAGSIVYDTPVNSGIDSSSYTIPASPEHAGSDSYSIPASPAYASNNGYGVVRSPEHAGKSGYSVSAAARRAAEKNQPQRVRLVRRSGAAGPEAMQLSRMLSSIRARLPRHAFAGRGSRMTHHSWLLDGEHLQAAALHTAVANLLSQRNSQMLHLKGEKLQEHGHWGGERDYIVIQQGITTVFLYIAPAGHDLYISRTTTVRPPFNPLRIALLVFAFIEFLLGPSVLSHLLSALAMHRSVVSGLALIVPVTIVVLLIPSVLFLVAFLLASLRHWYVEKDCWVYLRRNTLNDFEVDDVMLLEHVTDDAVRAAVDQLHLDATRISPPVSGYQPGRRIRTI
jgi:hypothetical protein